MNDGRRNAWKKVELPKGSSYLYHLNVEDDGSVVLPRDLLQRLGTIPGDRVTVILSERTGETQLVTAPMGSNFPWEDQH